MVFSTFLFWLAAIIFAGSVFCLGMGIGRWRRDSMLRSHCTERTEGKVTGYSTSQQITGSTFLPVVAYHVAGESHTVTGPTFASYTASTVKGDGTRDGHRLQRTNITDIDDLPDGLKVYDFSDAPRERMGNALTEPFPEGRRVPVFYDPDKPSRAYVIRMCPSSSMTKTFLLLGGIELVAAIVFLVIGLLW